MVDGLEAVFEVDRFIGAFDFLVEGALVVMGSLQEVASVATDALLEEGADVSADICGDVDAGVDPAVDPDVVVGMVAFAIAALFSAMMAWIRACSIALVDLRLLLLFAMVSFCVDTRA